MGNILYNSKTGKGLLFFSFIILSLSIQSEAQVIKGKLVDENNFGLAEVNLILYTSHNSYNTVSDSDGTFEFNNISGVEDNQLPSGYIVSDNFPNPFNPETRINITLPVRSNVKLEVFNLIGETVTEKIEQNFNAGTNFIDIELNELPNGIYFARISIDDKYIVIKKMLLIYGSQHLNAGNNEQMLKPEGVFTELILDSLVAGNNIIGSHTFTNLPVFTGGTLDLGNLTIERYCPGTPTVLYEGKLYNTVQIGQQCWFKENLDAGNMINGFQNATDNGIIEKYCQENDPANCDVYGGLYMWNETMQYITTPGSQGICPSGWHIPTLTEFNTLKLTVDLDGNSLKAIGQGENGGAGTNTSGFSALLAGSRDLYGNFWNLTVFIYCWSSTEYNTQNAYAMQLNHANNHTSIDFGIYKQHGFSVRCLKN
jgi:uncharacterized protein (TIGR02145 family)